MNSIEIIVTDQEFARLRAAQEMLVRDCPISAVMLMVGGNDILAALLTSIKRRLGDIA